VSAEEAAAAAIASIDNASRIGGSSRAGSSSSGSKYTSSGDIVGANEDDDDEEVQMVQHSGAGKGEGEFDFLDDVNSSSRGHAVANLASIKKHYGHKQQAPLPSGTTATVISGPSLSPAAHSPAGKKAAIGARKFTAGKHASHSRDPDQYGARRRRSGSFGSSDDNGESDGRDDELDYYDDEDGYGYDSYDGGSSSHGRGHGRGRGHGAKTSSSSGGRTEDGEEDDYFRPAGERRVEHSAYRLHDGEGEDGLGEEEEEDPAALRSHWNLATYLPEAAAEYFHFILGACVTLLL
jgi:hypothetical protein